MLTFITKQDSVYDKLHFFLFFIIILYIYIYVYVILVNYSNKKPGIGFLS